MKGINQKTRNVRDCSSFLMAVADWNEFCSLYFNLALQSQNCVVKLHHPRPIHNQQDTRKAQERVHTVRASLVAPAFAEFTCPRDMN